jgi:hypothetical protein
MPLPKDKKIKQRRKVSTKNKTVLLSSFVLFEKCSKKDFISNSEKYLNSIGIGIYIWLKSKYVANGEEITHASASTPNNLNKLIEIYGLNVLYKFYKVITSNKKLKELPHLQYNLKNKFKRAYLKFDGHHDLYQGNYIKDEFGQNHSFQIYCMTKNVLKSAGYVEELPF